MPAIKSRSIAKRRLVEFRHPLFFSDEDVTTTGDAEGLPLYPEFIEQMIARATWIVDHAKWVNAPEKERGDEPTFAPDPDLTQFVGQTFDEETCQRLGLPYDTSDESLYYMDEPRDSVWRFRRVKQGIDEDRIVGIMTAQNVDWLKLAEGYNPNSGELPQIDTNTRSIFKRAELEVMSVEAEGLFFTFLPWTTTGDVDGTDSEEIHPLAGKRIPLKVEWLWHVDPVIRDAAYEFLYTSYERRTPEQEATFPAGIVALADARQSPNRRGKGRTK